ncbi:hypothetical protein CYMTET_26741, partial [Cymbomonas tetramitiformis]
MQVACPGCRHVISIPPNMHGQLATCPYCKQVMQAPGDPVAQPAMQGTVHPSVQEVHQVLPHKSQQEIFGALQRHNWNKDAAVNELLSASGRPASGRTSGVANHRHPNRPFNHDQQPPVQGHPGHQRPTQALNHGASVPGGPLYGLHAAPAVGQAPPVPTGRKKALLIGINYTGT